MPNTQPLRLNGATYRKTKSDGITIVEPWEVYTIEECETFVPSSRPFDLPVTDRSATEFEVGTWKLMLTYQGLADDGVTGFDDEDAHDLELDGSMTQDGIKSHPYFQALKSLYNWSDTKEAFLETLPVTGSSSATGLGGTDGTGKTKPNPLYGAESFLAVGAIFRDTFTTRNAPNSVLDHVGEIISVPPAFHFLGIPAPSGRNWLKLTPKVSRKGRGSSVTLEYMLSGPNGWNKDVYNFSQILRARSGGRKSGLQTGSLVTGGLTTGSL